MTQSNYSAIRRKAGKSKYGGPKQFKAGGACYANGGRVASKKPGVVINVISGQQPGAGAPPAPPMPPAPPPMPPAPPGGGAPMNPGLAQAALSKMGAGPPPAGQFATGGRIPKPKMKAAPAMNASPKGFNTNSKARGQFAAGGKVETAGAGSGVGRLQKIGKKP